MFSFESLKITSVNYEFRKKNNKLLAIILGQEGRGYLPGIILISCNACHRIIILGFVV